MASKLHLAPTLAFPLEAITETIAILGIRGSGKTNTAAVYAEELLDAGQQVVILDPTDAWWGLKSSADGQRAGYPVVVLGGKHQDLPLASTDGKLVAEFVVEQGASVVCSLRGFESKGQELAFATAFLRRLYHLKGQQDAPTPLALMIDEASRLVPQRVMGEDAACVGAVQQIVRQGRSSGFGVVLIDQRAATVNKDVLTQMEMMIVHRTTSPQDRKALREWVEQHDAEGHGEEFLSSLATLKVGEAWVWSPGWLDLFKRVQMRARRTFDSSRTPRAGEVIVAPKKIADVDLEALRVKMAATLEKAKQDDPKELRRRIAELERQAKQTRVGDVPHAVMASQISAAVLAATKANATRNYRARGHLAKVRHHVERIAADAGLLVALVDMAGSALLESEAEQGTAGNSVGGASRPAEAGSTPAASRTLPAARPRTPVVTSPTGDVSASEQKILDALALMEQIGSPGKRVNLGFFAGYSEGGRFNNLLGGLRTRGLVEYPESSTVTLTDAGRALANADAHPVRTLDDLHALWLGKLPASESKVLRAVIDMHPASIYRTALGEATGYSEGGRFNNILGRLRSLGAIDYPQPGSIIATDALFPEGLT